MANGVGSHPTDPGLSSQASTVNALMHRGARFVGVYDNAIGDPVVVLTDGTGWQPNDPVIEVYFGGSRFRPSRQTVRDWRPRR